MERLGNSLGVAADLQAAPLRFYAGSIALVIVGLLGIGTGAWIAVEEQALPAAAFVGGAGLVCAALGAWLLGRRKSGWQRIEAHERGFALIRGAETRPVSYAEIDTLTASEKQMLAHGVRDGTERSVAARGRVGSISFRDCALIEKPDTFAPIFAAIVGGTARAVDARITAGESLHGKGWRIDQAGLHAGRGEPVALSLVDHVGLFDGKACLWRDGQDMPFFAVSEGGANARVLLAVAALHMKPADAAAAHGLGRVLFQKGHSKLVAFITSFFAFSTLGGGVAALIAGGDGLIGAAFMVPIGLGLALLAAYLFASRLLCHEKGVVWKSLFSARPLRYEEVERFSYSATRVYYNGAYVGTNLRLVFRAATGRPISFHSTVKGADEDLDGLRDHVARVVALRLRARLDTEPEVAWGGSAALSKDAVHYRPKRFFGLLGRGPRTSMPFSADPRFEIKDGTFSLRGKDRPPLSMQCAEENFYPGFVLLQQLAREATAKR